MVEPSSINDAFARVGRYVQKTPLVYSDSISRMTGARVFLKCENFQRTGSFKVRGAFNKLLLLDGEPVIAASMGNHAQGVAAAAATLGSSATIVMPEGVSAAKENAVRDYGAEVQLRGNSLSDAIEYATAREGLTFIHPYDDEDVIAGQGTVGVEITGQLDSADYVLVPVGGGGLISGVATWLKHQWPQVKVIGVQAEAATSALRSFASGEVVQSEPGFTIADGIAVGRAGAIALKAMRRYVHDIRGVGEASIARSVLMLMERKKMVVEGAGAVGLAYMMEHAGEFSDRTVVLVLSGGNIDFTLVDRIIRKGLYESGRAGILEVVMLDVPGSLHMLTGIISSKRGNILSVAHERFSGTLPVQKTLVRVALEVRDPAHLDEILQATRAAGLETKEVTE